MLRTCLITIATNIYLLTLTLNKYDRNICSLDIAQKHRRRIPKTLPSNKNILKSDINHVIILLKAILLTKINEGRSFMHCYQ